MPDMPQSQSINLNGLDITYYEWGQKNTPVLICLHSHTNTAVSWREFAEFSSGKYHVFALDQRGHGESQWATDGYARDKFVVDLGEFISKKGLSTFTLVGCSMGGWHSILYTKNNPEKVDRIVMVDIAPEPSLERLNAPPSQPAPDSFETLEDGADWIKASNAFATRERLEEDAKSKLKILENGHWEWKADLKGFDNPLPDMTDPNLIGRYWDAIETIKCPILEIRGSESGLVSDEVIERMEAKGNDVSSVDIPLAGHVVMVDQPESFISSIRAFIGM